MKTTTFSHYGWGSKGKTLRITSKPISPRATVLAGVDNLGNLYASVFLCNGNRQIFQLYLIYLVRLLDQESKDWRLNTVILMDGCPFHKAKSTRRMIRKLNIPTMYTSPYSAVLCPVEIIFSIFKRGELNVRGVKINK
jgi:transposase